MLKTAKLAVDKAKMLCRTEKNEKKNKNGAKAKKRKPREK